MFNRILIIACVFIALHYHRVKSQNATKEEGRGIFENIKSRIQTRLAGNNMRRITLDDVCVNFDWSAFSRAKSDVKGTAFILFNSDKMGNKKDIVSHMVDVGEPAVSLVVTELKPDKVYTGAVKLFGPQDEVRELIEKSFENSSNTEKFEIATPFLVEEKSLHTILETRDLIQEKLKSDDGSVKMGHADVTLKFRKIRRLGFSLEVANLNYEQDSLIVKASEPKKVMQLYPPISYVTLAQLPSNELIRVTLRSSTGQQPKTEGKVNIFTGGAYKLGTINLTSLLNSPEKNHQPSPKNANDSFSDYSGQVYETHLPSYKKVRCYSESEEEFVGFSCRKSDKCLPMNWVCDGEYDCPQRDDEFGCDDYQNIHYEERCRKYEFRCKTRGRSVCLPNSFLCDGRSDCDYKWDEDESTCHKLYTSARPGFMFHNRHGILDSDEECGLRQFRCSRGGVCLSPRLVCDGHSDCPNGEDESLCDNWSEHCDLSTEFRCYKSNGIGERKCIPRSFKCDDFDDCEYGEDEESRICNPKFSFNLLGPLGINLGFQTGLFH